MPFLLSFVALKDTCYYTDRYGVHYDYCHTLEIGGWRIPYEGLATGLWSYNLFSSSLDIHAYSYYYATVLMKRMGIPWSYRFLFFVMASIGWELFETYGWRTTPISLLDIAANAFGYTVGELGGERVKLVLGLQPIRRYPKEWVIRGEVNDGSPAYMLMGRFNTNFSPRTLYLRVKIGKSTVKLGYNLGASYGDVYMYYHPYDTSGIPSLYVSTDPPPVYVGRVPMPPVATRCTPGSLWCLWTLNTFLEVSLRY